MSASAIERGLKGLAIVAILALLFSLARSVWSLPPDESDVPVNPENDAPSSLPSALPANEVPTVQQNPSLGKKSGLSLCKAILQIEVLALGA